MATRTLLNAPVVEVTLLEDRAHVIRRGVVTVAAGASKLIVSDVSPVLADRTLSAVVLQQSGARINDVRVRRQRVVLQQDLPTEVQVLRIECEALVREIARLEDGQKLLKEQLQLTDAAVVLTLSEFGEDTAWNKAPEELWRNHLQAFSGTERGLRDKLLENRQAFVDATGKRDNLQRRIAALNNPQLRNSATVEADLYAAAAGDVEVQVEYTVPGACWRPQHTARLIQNVDRTEKVLFQCNASVWQNTGEDWRDASLNFSTQRPSLGTEPPKLQTELLNVQRRAAQVVVEAREQEIVQAGLGAGKKTFAPEVPGIDDGGEALKLRASHKATIPSDGRPWRVELFAFEAPAQTEWVLYPELVDASILKSTQTNTARFPVLAGPVELIRGSGFVGRTSLLYIAPNEKFALSWGPDSEVRVHREHRALDEDKSLLSAWITREHRVTLRLSNIGADNKLIAVTERVPVSEIEKVQIQFDAKNTSEQKSPDGEGFIKWSVALPAFGHATLNLRYTLRRHKDVAGV